MPVHDWTRVPARIYHHFRHGWIDRIAGALDRGALPPDYYAPAEQNAAGLGPDVLPLHPPIPADTGGGDRTTEERPEKGSGGLLLARPKVRPTAATDPEFYRRKQSRIAVHHVSGDARPRAGGLDNNRHRPVDVPAGAGQRPRPDRPRDCTHRLPLDRADEAYKVAADGQSGKVCIVLDEQAA